MATPCIWLSSHPSRTDQSPAVELGPAQKIWTPGHGPGFHRTQIDKRDMGVF